MPIAGLSQGEYMVRICGLDREWCLVVPIDVGRRSAMALIADDHRELVVSPFEPNPTKSGRELNRRARAKPKTTNRPGNR